MKFIKRLVKVLVSREKMSKKAIRQTGGWFLVIIAVMLLAPWMAQSYGFFMRNSVIIVSFTQLMTFGLMGLGFLIVFLPKRRKLA